MNIPDRKAVPMSLHSRPSAPPSSPAARHPAASAGPPPTGWPATAGPWRSWTSTGRRQTRGRRGGRQALGVHLGVGADISTRTRQAAIAQVESTLPPIIGLANVAGVSSPTDFLDVTPAEWDRVFNVNMRGTFLVTQRVLPAMIAAGVGRIVSVSSISRSAAAGRIRRCPTARPRRP